jgi:hypothetical protein
LRVTAESTWKKCTASMVGACARRNRAMTCRSSGVAPALIESSVPGGGCCSARGSPTGPLGGGAVR